MSSILPEVSSKLQEVPSTLQEVAVYYRKYQYMSNESQSHMHWQCNQYAHKVYRLPITFEMAIMEHADEKGVQLSASIEIEAYGDQAAAVSNQLLFLLQV